MPLSINLEGGSGVRTDAFDPVAALQVEQIVAQTGEGARMGMVAAAVQVLAQEIKHGGEGAK